MERLYRYFARNATDRPVEGELIARDAEDAAAQMRLLGLRATRLSVDAAGTAALWLAPDFDLRALASLYHSLGERVRHGGHLASGLADVGEFLDDRRLRAAVSMWCAADRGGFSTSEAMRLAGLPPRHVAAVAALEKSGAVDRALLSLAAECRRDHEVRSALARLARQPKLYGALALAAYWAAFAYLIPPVMAQLGRIGTHGMEDQPAFVRTIAAFSGWAQGHLLLWTLACLGLAVAAVAFTRSAWGRRAADCIPLWRQLSERADMAALWGGFAVLYDAGTPAAQAARWLAESARREQSRAWFLAMAASLKGGYGLDVAARRAGFPRYVSAAVTQAMAQQGASAEALQRFADARAADVLDLLDRLQLRVELLLKTGLGVLIAGLFAITYLPMFVAAQHIR